MSERRNVALVTVEYKEKAVVARIEGELDALAGPILEQKAIHAFGEGNIQCIVDLSLATFIDSIGVGTLVRIHRAVREQGGEMVVAGAGGMIAQLLEITKLHTVFRLAPDVESALKPGR